MAAEDRARSIEATLLEESTKLKKRFNTYLIVYGVIIVVALWYTNYVFIKINDYIGPSGLKRHGETMVNLIAQYPDQLVKMYDEKKDDLADEVVNHALEAMPEAESFLKNQVDVYNDKLGLQLRNKVMPGFREYVEGSLPALKAQYKEAKGKNPDLTMGMFFTDLYVGFLDKELAKLINEDQVIAQAEDLQRALYVIDKEKTALTQKQLAERKIIVNFILMAKLDSSGSPVLEELKKLLEKRFGVTKRQIEEDKVLPEIETDDKSEPL